MSNISANFKSDLGNGTIEVTISSSQDDDTTFEIESSRYVHDTSERERCEIRKIGLPQMKRLIKQMQTLVDIVEME